eukprot:sb/3466576/
MSIRLNIEILAWNFAHFDLLLTGSTYLFTPLSLTGKEVCTVMGLCSEEFQNIMRQATLMSALLSKNVGDIGCDTCVSLAGLVQKEVLANEVMCYTSFPLCNPLPQFQKQIETMLDQVCSVVPVDQNECDSFVNSAFETAISLFESYKAKELCQMAGLCQADDASALLGVGPVDISGSTDLLGKDDDCENGPSFWCASEENAKKCNMVDFCKNANTETTKQIETMLDQVCSVVPVDQNECDSFVNSAFETAISLFESYKAKELCQMAGLCQAGADDASALLGVGPVDISGSTDLLGKDDDCENGPSFWCASEENAKKCNMVDFCKNANTETTVF